MKFLLYNPSRFVNSCQMKKILIETGNPGKFQEISEFFKGLPLETVRLAELGIKNDCEETGSTYEENAVLKAKYFYSKTDGGMSVLADDSGIVVEALQGELGVYTRRWGAGHEVSDQQWLDFFLERMLKESNRNAKFICNVALYDGRKVEIFEGEVPGVLAQSIEAPIKAGVPLGSLFKPEGQNKVLSAMSNEEKAKFSHRGRAMAKVMEYLKTHKFN